MTESAYSPLSQSSEIIREAPQGEKALNSLLAKTVRKLRVRRGLSQEELASLASVDRTYISGIERARRNITIATLERLIPHLSSGSVEFFRFLATEIAEDLGQKSSGSVSSIVRQS